MFLCLWILSVFRLQLVEVGVISVSFVNGLFAGITFAFNWCFISGISQRSLDTIAPGRKPYLYCARMVTVDRPSLSILPAGESAWGCYGSEQFTHQGSTEVTFHPSAYSLCWQRLSNHVYHIKPRLSSAINNLYNQILLGGCVCVLTTFESFSDPLDQRASARNQTRIF